MGVVLREVKEKGEGDLCIFLWLCQTHSGLKIGPFSGNRCLATEHDAYARPSPVLRRAGWIQK